MSLFGGERGQARHVAARVQRALGLAALAAVTVGGRDIYRAAKLLVDRHGEDAPIHAFKQADELMDQGDMEGRAVWLRVKSAAEELLRTEAGGAVH